MVCPAESRVELMVEVEMVVEQLAAGRRAVVGTAAVALAAVGTVEVDVAVAREEAR